MKGVVFDVQRFTTHDGPGIRTTVFFKGCTARCGWCHNPESLSDRPEIQYYADRCLHCAKCSALCHTGAHRMDETGRHVFDRGSCVSCGLCAGECFSNALVLCGRETDLEEILRQTLDDKAYYDQSGGGVTLSGGEPVLQGDFCEALLKRLKDVNIHTCLQTAGFYPYAFLERLLPWLDLVMYDVKGLSGVIYSEHIHANMRTAVKNLRRLDENGVPIVVRTPCIAGVNDSPDEIEAIAGLLSELSNLWYYQLIPYHGLGKVKSDTLGKAFKAYGTPSKEHLRELERLAARHVRVHDSRGDVCYA